MIYVEDSQTIRNISVFLFILSSQLFPKHPEPSDMNI